MPRYIVHFAANPSAWPNDPSEVVTCWQAALGGGNQLLEQGLVDEIGWVSNVEGYGLLEADSKATVIGLVNGFFPFFSQEIMELVPHGEAGAAHVAGAKMAAESS